MANTGTIDHGNFQQDMDTRQPQIHYIWLWLSSYICDEMKIFGYLYCIIDGKFYTSDKITII